MRDTREIHGEETTMRRSKGNTLILALAAAGLCAAAPAFAASKPDAKAPPAPPPSITERYQAPCDQGDAMACRNLAIHLEKGDGVPQDKVQATALYEKACGLGEHESCNMAAMMYSNGDGVPADKPKAFAMYAANCKERQDPLGCLNAGVMQYKGEGTTRNVTKAVDLFKQACDLKQQQGCDYYNQIMGP